MTPDHRLLKARYGLGRRSMPRSTDSPARSTSRTSPIALAMHPPRSTAVPTERDFSPTELRFAQAVGAASWLVVPLVVGDKPLGTLYCDRDASSPPADAATIAFVRALCDGVIGGIAARRSTDAPRPETVTAEYKRDAVLRLFAGESLDVVSTSLGVAVPLLERWRREFLEGAMSKLSEG